MKLHPTGGRLIVSQIDWGPNADGKGLCTELGLS
jgi:hypothetical protein